LRQGQHAPASWETRFTAERASDPSLKVRTCLSSQFERTQRGNCPPLHPRPAGNTTILATTYPWTTIVGLQGLSMPQPKHARKTCKLAATGGLEICRGRHTSKLVGMFSFSFSLFAHRMFVVCILCYLLLARQRTTCRYDRHPARRKRGFCRRSTTTAY